MKQYTFAGVDPNKSDTTVVASNEAEARDLAMFKRWGTPDGAVLKSRPYAGLGLILINERETQ